MAALGADPDATTTTWDEDSTTPPKFFYGEVGNLVNYFCYHRRVKFGSVVPPRDRLALASSIKRLLNRGYTPESVRRAMDRFYTSRTSQNHPQPALAFTSTRFQSVLFSSSDRVLDEEGHVLNYLAAGFTRDQDMVIPWSPDGDRDLRMEFATDPGLSMLLRSYPDVVAMVLHHSYDYRMNVLDIAVHQHEYIMGLRPSSSTPFYSLMVDITFPPDFLKVGKARPVHDTTSEAVRNIP
jgi:hypothetical protein